ncbi:MAG: phosphotransferase [Streptosporangiales bacterium]|nr:phosphotransferase [Streptosporangiales bacterium]
MPDQDLGKLLEARLGQVFGHAVTVEGLRRLSGGASRETWAFAVTGGGEPRRLVLRRDPPGHGRPASMAREGAAIAAAAEEGVPVPPLVDLNTDPDVLGSPYLITEFVGGETIARRLLRDEQYAAVRPTLAAEFGRVLARLHRIPLRNVPGLERPDSLDALQARYDALADPSPAVEIGLRWLRRNRPDPVPDTVVHGDFRNGNLIISPAGLRAVLDWELVHVGDPRADLGWLCVKAWRFGSAPHVGGFGDREALLDGYAEVAGERPDPEAVRWWEVFGVVWWAVGCRGQAERHLAGETRSVELAAIGRRVCEQEHDLLLALGVPAPSIPEPPAAPPHSDLHGHPTLGELVEATEGFLRDEVMKVDDPRLAFQGRVAANVLGIVARELAQGAALEREHRERLAALGVPDTAAFAAGIRDGSIDADDPATLRAVRDMVTARLSIANPKYLTYPG